MKVFLEKGFNDLKGKVLPQGEFKLLKDLGELKVSEENSRKILWEADKILQEEIPALPASLYREFFINGNRANFESKCFARRRMAMYLAAAEYTDRKGKYTDKLIDVVWAIMEESTWILPAHLYNSPIHGDATLGPAFGENILHGLALFSASTGATLSFVYFLCKDILDAVEPIVAKKIEYTVKERVIHNFIQTEFWWGGRLGRRVNNWNPWIVSNVLLSTAVIENDTYIRETVATKSAQYLDNFLNQYKPDGGCDEGPSYWCAAGACLFDCLQLIEEMTDGKVTIYDSELVKNIAEYIFKVNVSKNRYVNFADGYSRVYVLPSMLIRYGEKVDSSFLTSFGKKLSKISDNLQLDRSYPYRALRCMFTSVDVADGEDCPMPMDTWLGNIEVMTARETPDDERGMFIAAKGGHNDESHNHNDIGNFMVYYNGKPVIIDPGVGVYTKQTFSPRRYELWFMQSGFHNLPSFDGIDQLNGAQYKAEDVVYSENEHKLSLELKGAYPDSAGIISYKRSMALNDGIVTIDEDIELQNEMNIEFHIMTLELPVIKSDGVLQLAEGREMHFDPSLEVNISEISTEGMSMDYSWSYDKMHRTKFIVKAKKCKVTFTIK